MEVDIFKKQLTNLDKLLESVKKQQKEQQKLNSQMEKFNQGILKAKSSADRLLDSFKGVFSVIKSIGFSSLMIGGAMGVKGVLAQKDYAKAHKLDLSTHELKALKYAGGQSQTANRDFLVDLATTLKDSLYTTDKAQNWASLGFDTEMLKQLSTVDLLKTFLSTVSERGLGDSGQNKNLQDILEGLTGNIGLADLKNINPQEIWQNYQRGLELTDNSADKLRDIGKGVNTLITTFETFIDKIQASLAPAFKELLDSLSNGLASLYNSKEFGVWLEKISQITKGLSANAVDYITNLTKSIPDLLRDMKIIFLEIMSALGGIAKVFTLGLNDSVNRLVKKTDQSLFEAEDAKYRDLHKRLNAVKTQKEFVEVKSELLDFTENGDRLTSENRRKLFLDIQTRQEEFKKEAMQQQTQSQGKKEDSQAVMQPINITVNNDPEMITQTHTLTNSINLGGWNIGGGR